jgi:hypothetical protein
MAFNTRDLPYLTVLRCSRALSEGRHPRIGIDPRFDQESGMDRGYARLLQSAQDLFGKSGVEKIRIVEEGANEVSRLRVPVLRSLREEAGMDGNYARQLQAAYELDNV